VTGTAELRRGSRAVRQAPRSADPIASLSHLHLVHFEPGRIEFRRLQRRRANLANRLGQLLSEWTGTRWLIAISEAERRAEPARAEESRERDLRNEVASHPLVSGGARDFSGATIAAVRERFAAAGRTKMNFYGRLGDEASTGEDET